MVAGMSGAMHITMKDLQGLSLHFLFCAEPNGQPEVKD